MSPIIDLQNDFVDRRIIAVQPAVAVIEDQEVSGARQALGNPVRVVLGEQALVLRFTGAIRSGIAPAIEEVAALATPAASVAGNSAVIRQSAVPCFFRSMHQPMRAFLQASSNLTE